MDRRDFLLAGVAGAASLTGCPSPVEPAPTDAVVEFLRKNRDAQLAIESSRPLSELLAARGVDPERLSPARLLHDESLFRDTLRALFVSVSFRDLAPDAQRDPRVQGLMWSSMDGMNAAMVGLADHFERISDDRRRAIGKRLREEPRLIEEVVTDIERKGKAAGVDPMRLGQLRAIGSQVSWRLRAQPLGLLLDEHVSKVRTLAARENRELLAQVVPFDGPTPTAAPGTRSSTKVATVGGAVLGVSLVVGAGGAAVASAAPLPGAIIITAGALGAIGGLITLIVGGVMAATGS